MTPASSKAKYTHATTPQDYFDQRVIKHAGYYDTDCWQFRNKGDRDGYPQIIDSIAHKQRGLSRAHRLSYYLHKGKITDGALVCHTCDHPWCVNPEHLFLGTWDDNVQDMVRKGRYCSPWKSGNGQKLTKEDKELILNKKNKEACTEVAKEFNISFSRVCQIWRGV